MSAECSRCGHDLAPDGVGLAPCEFCALRGRVEYLEIELTREPDLEELEVMGRAAWAHIDRIVGRGRTAWEELPREGQAEQRSLVLAVWRAGRRNP